MDRFKSLVVNSVGPVQSSIHVPLRWRLMAWLFIATLVCGYGCFILWCAQLRETPTFWMNIGGYPIWFREFLLIAYFPLFGVFFFLLSLLSLSSLRTLNTLWVSGIKAFALILLWTLFLACVLVTAM